MNGFDFDFVLVKISCKFEFNLCSVFADESVGRTIFRRKLFATVSCYISAECWLQTETNFWNLDGTGR
jgi:hypothetical protein